MTIQPMPELAPEQLESLRANIAENGVLVPVVKDQHGRILDGNNRAAIANELGMDFPAVVVEVADDADAWDKAVEMNCSRRHMTREQVRAVVAGEIRRKPDDSDRAIAKRVGCSPSTVGTVRARVSNLDSPERMTGTAPVTFSRLMRKFAELDALIEEIQWMADDFELDGSAVFKGEVYETDEQHDELTSAVDDIENYVSYLRESIEGR